MAIILPSSASTSRHTFLEIVQRVCQECGISGSGPSSVTSATGEYKRVVDWTSSSYVDVQHVEPNWAWMRESVVFNTTQGNSVYTPTMVGISNRFSSYDPTSFSCQLTSVGENDEQKLTYMDFETFRDSYRVGYTPESRPLYVTVQPNQYIALGPTPDNIYTISLEYRKTPQILTLDDDVPELPEQFWEVIMYRAMMKYARFEAAGEIYTDAEMNYKRIISRMRQNQLADVTVAGPLV